MTLLHDYFNLRNQQAFQRLLDGGAERGQSSGGLSNSDGRSWNRSSTTACDVNARDWLGRTVLHLACASPERIEYVNLLLRHPGIDVNLPDTESHWTALHRALYHANFLAAILLLRRTDTDRLLHDFEGYTAFDLYNSTLDGTQPSLVETYAELYTWGANRNAALGLGDAGDRTYPDQVLIQQKEDVIETKKRSLSARFSPIHVRQIRMSKLHTAIVTSESGGNLRLCGFGSGGRLGPGQHTQYSLVTLPQFTYTIISVALGQDHTLALTKSGEVLSWGLNRFSQLGYVVESMAAGLGRIEEPIQSTPRKVQGPLKKEIVEGIAASKGASACWTKEEVYTWGTNNGQLGYDKAAQPVQVSPRKVSKVTQPVLSISMTDSAMVCLLITHDVICIWNDRHIKITFPGHAFPPEMQPYRPPEAVRDAKIAKVTSCDDMFAGLAFNGELFTFSVPNPTDADGALGNERPSFKPQRVWALRKKFSAVKDVALGSGGSIIVCTESGHAFVRSRNAKSGQGTSSKLFKFQRIPYIQRVTQVCANSTGAFGALRMEYFCKPIEVCGNTIAQDLADIRPYLHMYRNTEARELGLLPSKPMWGPPPSLDPLSSDASIVEDIEKLTLLFGILIHVPAPDHIDSTRLPHGADVMVHVPSGTAFPAHRVILAARSHILRSVLDGTRGVREGQPGISVRLTSAKSKSNTKTPTRLEFSGCRTISVLLLLDFLYSDDLLAIWDRRISTALESAMHILKIAPPQVKLELCTLADILDLPLLASALEQPVKRVPSPSMVRDMGHLFQTVQTTGSPVLRESPLAPDVILQLADQEVLCHSVILRARSAFFASFFDDEEWTAKRWDARGMVTVDMRHLKWHHMDYILRFMCCGTDAEMFDVLEFVDSVDEMLEFMFDVMAAANELLLDRLVLLCSAVISKHININNASYILADATYFHAEQLVERLQSYMTANMELLLESGMLDDIPVALVKDLALFARRKQVKKSPISRSNRLAHEALAKHADWLALQDIPHPIPRPHYVRKDSAKLSPPGPSNRNLRPVGSEYLRQSTTVLPQGAIRRPPSSDDLFTMDVADVRPLSRLGGPRPAPLAPNISDVVANPSPAWNVSLKPRVDMKAVMTEAAKEMGSRRPQDQHNSSRPSDGIPDATSSRGPLRNASSVWGPTPDQSLSGPPPSDAPLLRAPSTSIPRVKEPSVPSLKPGPKTPVPSTPPRSSGSGTQPGLGPVITPTRQLPSPANASLSRASGKAWSQPVSPPAQAPSPPTSGMSFAAIQQLQSEQVAGRGKSRRSLREIQEEEKALQEEADFLTWWTAEEERIKLESQLASLPQSGQSKQPRRRGPRRATGNKADEAGAPTRPAHRRGNAPKAAQKAGPS